MLPALHFAGSSRLLGRFRSPPALLALSTLLGLIVLATNAVLVTRVVAALGGSLPVLLAALLFSACYAAVCVRLVWSDIAALTRRLAKHIGSLCTILRYKLSACCWTFCGL